MPRQLGENVRNILRIDDKKIGEVVKVYFRNPTTEERVRFYKARTIIKGKGANTKVSDGSATARQKFGMMVITGFEESKPNAEGKMVGGFSDEQGDPITWQKDGENYRPDWKEFILKSASEYYDHIADFAFDGLSVADNSDEEDDDSDDTEGETQKA
jgi:hypothetical protein